MAAALIFRMCCAGRDIDEVSLSLADGSSTLVGPVVRKGIVGPRGVELPLNFTPALSGSLAVQLIVTCRRIGSCESETWSAPMVFLVEDSGAATSPLTINVNNEGDLAEISLGALGGRLAGASSSEERLRRLANPHLFRPVDGLRLAASPSRLTLVSGGKFIHLVARCPAWFGRQCERPEKGRTTDNAIVLRCFAPDGMATDPDSSRLLSRTHFMLEPAGKTGCRVRDGAPSRDASGNILPGGVAKPSAGGLSVDGAHIAPGMGATFFAGATHRVTLSPDMRDGGVMSLDLSVLAAASGEAAGAVLSRTDAAPERYLVLWGETVFDNVDPALAGYAVAWDGVRFIGIAPDGMETALVPGVCFGPPGREARVQTFRQHGL